MTVHPVLGLHNGWYRRRDDLLRDVYWSSRLGHLFWCPREGREPARTGGDTKVS